MSLQEQMDELRECYKAISKDQSEIKEAFVGTIKEPGIAHIVRAMFHTVYGDPNSGKKGHEERIATMEHKDDRRTGWISGAVFVAGGVGIAVGWVLQHFWK